ncbi:MAG: hypothetical protein Kow00129_03730 [Thermoleophilia bacterium]
MHDENRHESDKFEAGAKSGPSSQFEDKSGPSDPAAPPLYMDRYYLETVLGRGGTCTVYMAWDTRLHRHVALKRLEAPLVEDPHARARFNREGRAIARLSHPHLVTLIDRGSTEDEEYLVFEYVEGRSLKEVLREGGPLEPRDACRITGQIAEGLAQAHLAGIIHRDVKPQNILLDAEGRAKLTDFGIATGADLTKVTRAGSIIGSGRYMSPEQVQSRPVDARSDIYSLGIVLFEMLAGRPPFDGQSIAEIGRRHIRDRPPSLTELRPDLPPELERIVMRCLEKLPENRFQSMEELLGALVGLGFYTMERTSGGLVESLKRVGRRDPLSDTGDWTPPPGTHAPPPDDLPAAPADRRISRAERRRQASERRASRRRGRAGLAAALLGVLIVASGLLWLLTGSQPEAPEVVGLTLEEARTAATEAGLDIVVSDEQVPALDPGNIVVEQTPAAGQEAESGVLQVAITRPAESVAISEVEDLDPEGDQTERPEQLSRLYDADPETAWTSEGYSTPSFGTTGKTGIGLHFRLTAEAALMRITSQNPGWQGDLQVPTPAGGWEPVAELTGQAEQTITLEEPSSEIRIWITSLPDKVGEDNYHRVGISEVGFYR